MVFALLNTLFLLDRMSVIFNVKFVYLEELVHFYKCLFISVFSGLLCRLCFCCSEMDVIEKKKMPFLVPSLFSSTSHSCVTLRNLNRCFGASLCVCLKKQNKPHIVVECAAGFWFQTSHTNC